MRIKTGELWELAFSLARVRRRGLQGNLDSIYPGFNSMDSFEKKIVHKAGIELTGEELFINSYNIRKMIMTPMNFLTLLCCCVTIYFIPSKNMVLGSKYMTMRFVFVIFRLEANEL